MLRNIHNLKNGISFQNRLPNQNQMFPSNYCWSGGDTRSYTQTHDFANIEHLHGFHIFIYHMKL